MIKHLSFVNEDHIQLFQSGEERGFDHYFKAWYKQFCFFAANYTKDQTAAEDIVADCFIKVWNKRAKFTHEAMLKSYFYTAISNSCKRWLENQKRHQKNYNGLIHFVETTEQAHYHNIIKTETLSLLRQAVESLPARCRQVFVKMYIEEKSVKEIASEMNTTVSTVKNQQARGLKLLKPKLVSLSPAGGGSSSI